jgi:hypothetical protein
MPATVVILARLQANDGGQADPARVREAVVVARGFHPRPILAYCPSQADPHVLLGGVEGLRLRPVDGEDEASCAERALQAAYEGYPLLLIGASAGAVPARLVSEALDLLAYADATFVPTGDGRFSCMALRRPVSGFAGALTRGEGPPLDRLTAYLEGRGMRVAHTASWQDEDEEEEEAPPPA